VRITFELNLSAKTSILEPEFKQVTIKEFGFFFKMYSSIFFFFLSFK